jgi:NAD(P)-dependent dehydrogenase (short-subunit alcohol dehydrogenase family)
MSPPATRSPTARRSSGWEPSKTNCPCEIRPAAEAVWPARAYRGGMDTTRTAIVTGASRGLGLALARELSARGWNLVVDARGADALAAAHTTFAVPGRTIAVPGDVTDPAHREALIAAAWDLGGLDLLVNNASALGPSPMPPLAQIDLAAFEAVLRTNLVAPLALMQEALPLLAARQGRIVNITSDAAVEGYEGWGGYGASKAGLEQLSNVLAAEQTDLRVYWVDPGDMRTQMHQDAFPGEDISDRPPPEESVPGLLALIDGDHPSGRYQARVLAETRVAG